VDSGAFLAQNTTSRVKIFLDNCHVLSRAAVKHNRRSQPRRTTHRSQHVFRPQRSSDQWGDLQQCVGQYDPGFQLKFGTHWCSAGATINRWWRGSTAYVRGAGPRGFVPLIYPCSFKSNRKSHRGHRSAKETQTRQAFTRALRCAPAHFVACKN
jgi:hypothetical protein